ncbi:MAG TPA: transporter substrate-binding domain-containing protein [Candidatus Competibacteraceae bacterium]|nr:transporter substrate-binding domain-containing protein [Candidatus Competibacteraceae bacterium]
MNIISRLAGGLLILTWALAATVHAQSPATPYALPDATTRPWTGDLDGMIQRRQIRILAPYSKTFYFIDRGAQHGLAYEVGRVFEDDLNQKLNNKHIRVHVVFVPVDRDQIIPSLLEGRGDIAMANLTITPERLKQVDFTDPTRRNVAEIVVTGPASAPIQRWPRKIGRLLKWSFCSNHRSFTGPTLENRDEKNEKKPLGGLQGQGSLGSAQGRQDPSGVSGTI